MRELETLSDCVRMHAERISESGPAALAGLFDLTSQRLFRLAAAITHTQHDAEDAVQAVMLRVAEQPNVLLQATLPWPYLLRMTRNEALLIVRRRGKFSTLETLVDLLTRRTVDDVELADTKRAIWVGIRRLPVEQSEVVVLKIWEELTFAEISELLELPLSTVTSRYRYALCKLATHLGSDERESADV